MSVALRGTFMEKLHESIKFAEDNRAYAVRLSAEKRDEVMREFDLRYRALEMKTSPRIAAAVDTRLAEDPRFKVAVSNEQWGGRLATMYGLVELVAAQREANSIAREQLDATHEQNVLLREIILQQDASGTLLSELLSRTNPVDVSGPTVPQQREST